MLNILQISDFKMHSKNQTENFKILQDDLKKNDHLKHPLLKMQTDIRLRLVKHPLLKMQTDILLQDLGLHMGFQKFFTDPPGINRIHPP